MTDHRRPPVSRLVYWAPVIFTLMLPTFADAQSKADADRLPPGVIASSMRASGSVDIDSAAAPPVAGGEELPVRASITRGEGECEVSLTNKNEEFAYVLNVDVQLFGDSESLLEENHLRERLAPLERKVRNFPCDSDQSIKVVLRSGERKR